MADLSDVEDAIVAAVSAALYPNGSGQPSTVGVDCRVYRGWPNGRALDADLAAGKCNVSIFQRAGMTRNTTRRLDGWRDTSLPTPTITVATSGTGAVFGGVAGPNNLCGVRANGIGYAYAAAPADTPSAIGAALRALIPGATGTAATVSVAGAHDVLGRVVAIGTAAQETRRQAQAFLISFWCPSPPLRDSTAAAVDNALAAIEFLTLADGTGGRLIYQNTFVNDAPTKDALWRRDITYTVEYPTIRTVTTAEMMWGEGTVTVQGVSTNITPQ